MSTGKRRILRTNTKRKPNKSNTKYLQRLNPSYPRLQTRNAMSSLATAYSHNTSTIIQILYTDSAFRAGFDDRIHEHKNNFSERTVFFNSYYFRVLDRVREGGRRELTVEDLATGRKEA